MLELTKTALRKVLPRSVYGPIRARRVRRLVDTYTPRIVEHRYAGFPMRVSIEDPLAEAWYDRDWEEPTEIAELRRAGRLQRGATVIDVGAHQGVVALILAHIVGREGQVIAVEAEAHNAAVARRNAQANGIENLTVLHAAGGARGGTLSFTEGLNGVVAPGRTPGAVEVPSVSVDELAARYGRPDVVLVDVEGYEAHVLAGAGATIAAGQTDFFVELHAAPTLAAAGSVADDVFAPFTGGGFAVVVADADETVPKPDGAEAVWLDASAMVHRGGQRCFIVARADAGRAGYATT